MEIAEFYNENDSLDSFMCLASYVMSCEVAERERVRDQWKLYWQMGWECPRHIIPAEKHSYSSATISEKRYSPSTRAEACLVESWLSIGSDVRDRMVGWAILYNELIIAGVDLRDLFARVGSLLGGEVGEEIVQFSEHSEQSVSMNAFGLCYILDPDGNIVRVDRG